MIRPAHATPGTQPIQRARHLPEGKLVEIVCAAPLNGWVVRETNRLWPGVFFAERKDLDFNVPRLRVIA